MIGAAGGMVALIEKKKRGEALDPAEIRSICEGYLAGAIPDYQVAAWLMAVCWRGMTEAETVALTRTMVESGETLDWGDLPKLPVDKHSTGGVGDKTSLVLVPLVAAAGVPFVKMSGRGLGHTGGTLDKLESIPGFRVELDTPHLRRQVARIGCALVGQTPELVPADSALYALRDVTGTVNSIPLIASSIMSKKLAAGAGAIVLDVKHGTGALLSERAEAAELARTLVDIGTRAGRRVRALLTRMDAPLGCAVGNALEVREAVETLAGHGPRDLWNLALELGAHLLVLAGATDSLDAARQRLEDLRSSGSGREKLAELIEAQGGDPRVVEDPRRLPGAPVVERLASARAGWLERADARMIAGAALSLGAGRRTKEDAIDHRVGVRLLARPGDEVEAGGPLAEIHAATKETAASALRQVEAALTVATARPQPEDASIEVID